jgi:hypothetical protein
MEYPTGKIPYGHFASFYKAEICSSSTSAYAILLAAKRALTLTRIKVHTLLHKYRRSSYLDKDCALASIARICLQLLARRVTIIGED